MTSSPTASALRSASTDAVKAAISSLRLCSLSDLATSRPRLAGSCCGLSKNSAGTAALAGAGVGAQVRSMYGEPGQPGGNGHCMIAIDPAVVGDAEQFATALTTLLEQVGAAGDRYPGEQRMAALQRARSEGVALDPDTQTTLDTLRAQARSQRRRL